MDSDRAMDTLGALILALTLILPSLILQAIAPSGAAALPALSSLSLPEFEAVALGWPVRSDCGDPRAWEALPRIGPVMGSRLATHAAAGDLRSPSDLLRVHGIGTKMASALAARVTFVPGAPPETAP